MSWSREHRVFVDWLYDIVGAMLHAVGVWCFIEPCKIAPGGASGIALLINHLFRAAGRYSDAADQCAAFDRVLFPAESENDLAHHPHGGVGHHLP